MSDNSSRAHHDSFSSSLEKWLDAGLPYQETEPERHLREGSFIYRMEEQYSGYLVREYPDGKRELVTVNISEDRKSHSYEVVREIP